MLATRPPRLKPRDAGRDGGKAQFEIERCLVHSPYLS